MADVGQEFGKDGGGVEEDGGRGRKMKRKEGGISPGHPGWRFLRRQEGGPAQSRSVVARQIQGRLCGCTSGTGTSGTQW